jgi:transcription antitermination factor NusG
MHTEVLTMSGASQPWYAVHVKTSCEQRVRTHLEQKSYPVFLPTQRIRRRWADRVKVVDVPLFPGYVFCQLNSQCSAKVVTTPGVLKIVGSGRQPAAIADEEIAALQRFVRANIDVEPWPYFAMGQMVRINVGPLAGVEGRVVSIANSWRLIVSVTLLQRSVAVAVEREWLVPVKNSAPVAIAQEAITC